MTNVSIQEESATIPNNINSSSNNNPYHSPIEHLVLVVHGIGKHEENWVQKLGKINILFQQVSKITNKDCNVKFVGIEWHTSLHQQTDKFIEKITPPGIPVIRTLVNHTMLDILFFTSPTYSQTIYTEVGNQLNEVYDDFIKRNPTFIGKVSILAHSLGSMICFDLLCNQPPNPKLESINTGNIYQWRKHKQQQNSNGNINNNGDLELPLLDDKFLSKIEFPKLHFEVYNLYAIGSPIAVLSTCRGHTKLDIPQCVNLFNIHDPSDPVAYLIEPLIDDGFSKLGESTVTQFSVRKKILLAEANALIAFNQTNTTIGTTINSSGTIGSSAMSTGSSLFSKISNKLPKFNRGSKIITSTTTTTTTNGTGIFQTNSNNTTNMTIVEKEMISLDYSSNISSNNSSNNISPSSTSSISTPKKISNTPDIESDDERLVETNSNSQNEINSSSSWSYKAPNSYISSNQFSEPIGRKTTREVNINNTNENNNNISNNNNTNGFGNGNSIIEESPTKLNNINKSFQDSFFGGHRFDFKLKPKGLLNFSEYSSVISAHKSYWDSKDVMLFMIEKN